MTGSDPCSAWPGRMVRTGAGPLYVRRAAGPGTPLVFVHGLGGSSTNWTELMAGLRDEADCYAVDLPGFGWSPPPANDRYALADHVRAVAAFIESLEVGAVHLVGNSLGGVVCVQLAAQRPELVRSLVLISPALPDLDPRSDLRRVAVALPLVPVVGELAVRAMARGGPEQRVRRMMALVYADPSRLPPWRLAESVEEVRRRSQLAWDARAFSRTLRGLLRAYLHPGSANLWRTAGRVDAPVLLLWGSQDRLVAPRVGQRAARVFPRAELVVFPDAGHVVQMELPARTVDAVRSWRRRLNANGEPRVQAPGLRGARNGHTAS